MIVVHCAVYNAPCYSVGAVYTLPRAPPRVSHRVNSDIACCALRNVYYFGVEHVLDLCPTHVLPKAISPHFETDDRCTNKDAVGATMTVLLETLYTAVALDRVPLSLSQAKSPRSLASSTPSNYWRCPRTISRVS